MNYNCSAYDFHVVMWYITNLHPAASSLHLINLGHLSPVKALIMAVARKQAEKAASRWLQMAASRMDGGQDIAGT